MAKQWAMSVQSDHVKYNLLLVAVGTLCMVGTGSYIANSFIVSDFAEVIPRPTRARANVRSG